MNHRAVASISLLAVAAACLGATPDRVAAQEEFLPPGWMENSTGSGMIVESEPLVAEGPAYPSGGCDCGSCSSCGCGDCGCGVCSSCCSAHCYGCASPWTIRTGGLLLKRDSPARTNLLLDNAQDPLLRANALHFDYEGGMELSVMHDHGSGICASQARFLFFGDWETHTQLTADSPFIATNPLTQITGEQDITAVYWTRMFGFELNYVEQNDCRPITYIVGFRYLNLDERLSLRMRNPNLPSGPAMNHLIFWDTDNDLFGGQIGADVHFRHPVHPVELNCVMKVGAYLNDARTNAVVNTNFGSGPFNGGVNEGDPAFLAELNLNLRYDVACYASLYGGYNLLWVDGVALASEQTARTGNMTAGNPIRLAGDTASLLLHGISFGVEFRY